MSRDSTICKSQRGKELVILITTISPSSAHVNSLQGHKALRGLLLSLDQFFVSLPTASLLKRLGI